MCFLAIVRSQVYLRNIVCVGDCFVDYGGRWRSAGTCGRKHAKLLESLSFSLTRMQKLLRYALLGFPVM